jgi:hypothetical protein
MAVTYTTRPRITEPKRIRRYTHVPEVNDHPPLPMDSSPTVVNAMHECTEKGTRHASRHNHHPKNATNTCNEPSQ